jgi:hypothetical protein
MSRRCGRGGVEGRNVGQVQCAPRGRYRGCSRRRSYPRTPWRQARGTARRGPAATPARTTRCRARVRQRDPRAAGPRACARAPRARRARYQAAIPAALYRPLELFVALEQTRENPGASCGVSELALVANQAARGDGKYNPDAVLATNRLHLDKLRLALAQAVNDNSAMFLRGRLGGVAAMKGAGRRAWSTSITSSSMGSRVTSPSFLYLQSPAVSNAASTRHLRAAHSTRGRLMDSSKPSRLIVSISTPICSSPRPPTS